MGQHPKLARQAVLQRHSARLAALQVRTDAVDQRFFYLRAGVLILGGTGGFLALFITPGRTGLIALAILLLAFSIIVFFHRRLDHTRQRLRLAQTAVSNQLARMQLKWQDLPEPVHVPIDLEHPFAVDLNIAGPASLHHLIDSAASTGGSLRLADWLLDTHLDPEKVRFRQETLRELLLLAGFRRQLALRGLLVKEKSGDFWSAERLLAWLKNSTRPRSLRPVLIALLLLAGSNIILLGFNLLGVIPSFWTISLGLYAALYLHQYRQYTHLVEDTFYVGQALNQFRAILVYLEAYSFPKGSLLEKLVSPFKKKGERPSTFIRKILWYTTAASLGNNQFLALFFNILVPWNMIFADRMADYKNAILPSLSRWLETWYELEALNSLAGIAYLNPGWVLPNLVEIAGEGEAKLFEARDLGHPLIPDGVKVRNDFKFSTLGEIALITGSNMSGKSTFLRTLGVNLCLAYAGGPVDASVLNTGPFRVFTCIQISDSLLSGISYFYAEVRRLKALLDAVNGPGPYPLFFLIDEIFRGTNNRERRIGSQAYLSALATGCGVGAVSTHDLELVKLAAPISRIYNYHFREDVFNSRMVFDYNLRSGPSPTTNALKIMKLEGLPIAAE
jgi:hypothetical protein